MSDEDVPPKFTGRKEEMQKYFGVTDEQLTKMMLLGGEFFYSTSNTNKGPWYVFLKEGRQLMRQRGEPNNLYAYKTPDEAIEGLITYRGKHGSEI